MSMSSILNPPGVLPNSLASSTTLATTTVTTTTTTFEPAAITLAPNHAFVKLCLLWTALHRTNSLPPACEGVLSEDNLEELHDHANLEDILERINSEKQANVFHQRPRDLGRDNHMKYHYRYTTRSLSVIGVLGGIVLILLVVALSTCIRNRRNILLEHQTNGHESFARQILIDHIRHLSSSRRINRTQDTPPSYDDVVKTEEDAELADEDPTQPPSYVEAMVQRRTSEVSLTPISIEEPAGPIAETPKLPSQVEEPHEDQQSHVVQIEVPGVHNQSHQRSHSTSESMTSVDGAKASTHLQLEMK